MMYQRDFRLLAYALSSVRPEPTDTPALVQWWRSRAAIMNACKESNPRFKEEIFVRVSDA